jgi:CCR4-NOT transcription complex subunit 7/8
LKVARPVGNFKNSGEFHYQTLRCNVDLLKLIQLGLTFTDSEGNLPIIDGQFCLWQFNFREFRLKEDVYAQDSIELLKQSGIDFIMIEERGIDVHRFGELLMVSGVVLNKKVKWLTFHSGYDFGYLVKLLTCAPLPDKEKDFFGILNTYFPCIFDMKYLMKFTSSLHGGLSKLAEYLNVDRIGPQHQAGSDSLLTACTFFKLCSTHFMDSKVDRHMGILYGLGQDECESFDA